MSNPAKQALDDALTDARLLPKPSRERVLASEAVAMLMIPAQAHKADQLTMAFARAVSEQSTALPAGLAPLVATLAAVTFAEAMLVAHGMSSHMARRIIAEMVAT